MDNKRFDSLTKALASGQSRRSVIKGLLGLGGAAAVATVLPDDTLSGPLFPRPEHGQVEPEPKLELRHVEYQHAILVLHRPLCP